MKKCFKCNEVKHLSEFYKHKQMADGHVNKCKTCNKKDVKDNRDLKSDYYKEYDAWRFQNQPQVKDRHIKYQSTEGGILKMRKSQKKWITNNPEKRAAHIILGNAVRNGKLTKPKECSVCGEFKPSRQIHAHHHDYTKPIDVTWLCSYCHKQEHKGDLAK